MISQAMISQAKMQRPWFVLGFMTVAIVMMVVMVVMFSGAVSALELPKDTIVLEAESGQLDKGAAVVDDKKASAGKAIDSQREARTIHEISLPKAGKWYVWIRLFCPDPSADSYWIGMDNAEPNPWDAAGGKGAVKIYSEAGDSANMAEHALNIWYWDSGVKTEPPANRFFEVKNAGKYLLWSKGREARTLLDQILLTPDEKFNTEQASKGAAIAMPQAVSHIGKLAVSWGDIKSR